MKNLLRNYTPTYICQDDADNIVFGSEWEPMLDGEFEITNKGFVYGLEDGGAIIVHYNGILELCPAA